MNKKFQTNYKLSPVNKEDCSNKYFQEYVEIPPFTKDEKGNWLNDTSVPKFVEGKKIDIQEQVQSYYELVDLKHLLARVESSGDDSILHVKNGIYADISDMPDDFNFENALAAKQAEREAAKQEQEENPSKESSQEGENKEEKKEVEK